MTQVKTTAKAVAALASIVLLSGCATNAIRLDRARTMVEAGSLASSATESLLKEVKAENREVLLDIFASDPNCLPPDPVIADPTDVGKVDLCRPREQQRRNGDFTLDRITRADLLPTLKVIEGLAGYLDKVDEVLGRDPVSIGAELEAAYGDLVVLQDAALAVAGSSAKPLALNSDQQSAISGALKLLDTIQDERGRVDDLQKFEISENRREFESTLNALEGANTRWLAKFDTQMAHRRTMLEDRLDEMPDAAFDKRRDVAAALMTTIERQEQLPELGAALRRVTGKLKTTHAAYLELLDNSDAELTAEERRKRAKLNRERFMGALKSFTALIRAF